MKARACGLFALCTVAAALHAHQADQQPPTVQARPQRVAFVTMWLSEEDVPPAFRWKKGQDAKPTEKPVADAKPHAGPISVAQTSPPGIAFLQMNNSGATRHSHGHMSHMRGKHMSLVRFVKQLADMGSNVPLVVLASSNFSTFRDAAKIYPNIRPYIMSPRDYIKPSCNQQPEYALTYQKLLIFKMLKYDKLLWLDLDLKLQRNIDHLFNDTKNFDLGGGKHVFGQAWDIRCIGCPTPVDVDPKLSNFWTWCHEDNSLCGGMMLFQPSLHLYHSLIDEGNLIKWCTGEDNIINGVLNQPAKYGYHRRLFQRQTICFPQCQKVEEAGCNVVHDAWTEFPV